MKTTKCIALLLAIVMTLALFAGCSNSPANDPATDAPATDAPSTAPDNSDNTDGNDIPAEGLTFPNPVEAPETITTVGPDGSPAAWYTELELTPEELTAEVKVLIAEVGATSMKEMGKVMGVASKRLAGRADGKDISAKVKELLS